MPFSAAEEEVGFRFRGQVIVVVMGSGSERSGETFIPLCSSCVHYRIESVDFSQSEFGESVLLSGNRCDYFTQ